MREAGYYWIRLSGVGRWAVGEWRSGYWRFIGTAERVEDGRHYIVGDRISQPEDAPAEPVSRRIRAIVEWAKEKLPGA